MNDAVLQPAQAHLGLRVTRHTLGTITHNVAAGTVSGKVKLMDILETPSDGSVSRQYFRSCDVEKFVVLVKPTAMAIRGQWTLRFGVCGQSASLPTGTDALRKFTERSQGDVSFGGAQPGGAQWSPNRTDYDHLNWELNGQYEFGESPAIWWAHEPGTAIDDSTPITSASLIASLVIHVHWRGIGIGYPAF